MSTNALADLMAGITTPNLAAQAMGIDIAVSIPRVDLALPMYDYQMEAAEHVLRDPANSPYGYVGLDMGLGKTPTGICVAASAVAVGQRPFLVIVPPSLRINWVREFRKFAPWLSLATIGGKEPNEKSTILIHEAVRTVEHDVVQGLPDVDVMIMGDSSISGWSDYLAGITRDPSGRILSTGTCKVAGLVVDEAHRFKNKSKRASALVSLSETIPGLRVLMSGTPMPNGRHAELAQQVEVMGKGAWKDIGGLGQFWNYYCPKIDSWGGRGNKDSEGLHEAMTKTWFFRRLRDQVLDLPAKGRSSVSLEGRGKAVSEYKKAEDSLIDYLRGKSTNGRVTPGQQRAEALLRMTTLRKLAGEAKIEAAIEHVKDILDNEPGGVFVVCEHRAVMDRMITKLMKYNPGFVMGGMSDSAKQESIDAFNSGESRVLVGQIVAAGVGLTLHGDGKNHRVLVVQLPWTPADLRQAEDRLHRIGQTHDVMVEVALCAIDGRWTIDERLWNLLETKHFNTTTVIDGEGEFLLGEVQEGVLDTYR